MARHDLRLTAGLCSLLGAAAFAQNAAALADYRSGSAKAFGFLMGQAMKAAGGRADPKLLSAALREALDGTGNEEA